MFMSKHNFFFKYNQSIKKNVFRVGRGRDGGCRLFEDARHVGAEGADSGGAPPRRILLQVRHQLQDGANVRAGGEDAGAAGGQVQDGDGVRAPRGRQPAPQHHLRQVRFVRLTFKKIFKQR